jgi:pimeloyl-ACP methyl ester carboxylesterase
MSPSADPARTHRTVPGPAGRIHVVEQGSGPLVLLVHGFPESWYSWRHQLPALAAAGGAPTARITAGSTN